MNKVSTVLVIEDNEDHAELTQEALEEAGTFAHIIVTNDGESALDYLYRRQRYQNPADSPRPDLILLDVQLPKMTGFEVLKAIKSDENLKQIPVVLLTTSSNQDDIVNGSCLGSNDYIIKPAQYDIYIQKIKGLARYWAFVSDLKNREAIADYILN
ncbi:MAG: response regulator [Spirochaetales bacterium]|nr:response regulator [Spirochaetales bacterium]